MTRGFLLDGLLEKVGDLAPSLAAKLGPIDDWLAVRVYLDSFERSIRQTFIVLLELISERVVQSSVTICTWCVCTLLGSTRRPFQRH